MNVPGGEASVAGDGAGGLDASSSSGSGSDIDGSSGGDSVGDAVGTSGGDSASDAAGSSGADSGGDAGDASGGDSGNSSSGSGSGSSSGGTESSAPCSGGNQCDEAPPSGWSGPLQLFEGAPGSVPSCAGAFTADAYDGNLGLNQAPAQCTCACASTATGATCQPHIAASGQSGCATTCGSIVTAATCTPLTICAGQGALFVKATATVTGGNCGSPTQSGTTLPPATWTGAARACALASAATTQGCSAGQVCAPSSASGVCIMTGGSVACPTGSSYHVQHVFYAGFAEGRSCSTCSCIPTPGTGSCGGTFTMYNVDTAGSCSSSTATFPLNVCENPQSGTQGVTASLNVVTQPSCSPSGGVAQGSATPATPTTICCTQ